MKVDTTAQFNLPTFSRSTSGSNPGAFEQTLRALERDMWSGAEAGRMTGREPSATRAEGVREPIPDTAPVPTGQVLSTARGGAQNLRADPDFPSERSDVKATDHQSSMTVSARHMSAGLLDLHCAIASSPALRTAGGRVESTTDDVHPITPAQTRGADRPRAAAPETRRTTLYSDENVIQLTLRLPVASREESFSIARRTYDELRRRGLGSLRVVVNGIPSPNEGRLTPINVTLDGETHGN